MRLFRFVPPASTCAALALAACSAGTAVTPIAASSRAVAVQPGGNCINPLLEFVSDKAAGEIYVYNGTSANACLVISHVPQPGGMDVNSAGTMYVASASAHRIFVYKAPYTALSQTIVDGVKLPGDVALCKGFIAATNLTTNTVTIFSYAGATLRVLNAPPGVQELYATCDPAGNLFTDGTIGGVTNVVEFKNGIGAAIPLNSLAAAIAKPGGLEWENGRLWVDDQTSLSISIWPAPFTAASAVIHLAGAVDPVKFEVSPSDATILSADSGLDRTVFYNLSGTPIGALNPFTAGGTLIGANYNKDDSP